jgi:hypothetical protein
MHLLRMKVFDPLVSVEPSAQGGLRGWAVAAAIIARLQEVGLSGGIDVPAIIDPAISDPSESELEAGPTIIWAAYGYFAVVSRALRHREAGSLSGSTRANAIRATSRRDLSQFPHLLPWERHLDHTPGERGAGGPRLGATARARL